MLVNNAGIDTDYLPVEHANIEDWRRMFETNVFGVVALTSAAIPILRANQPAVVCTITSSSIIAAVPFFSAYRASKAAVSAFGDSLRVEVAPFGIRVVEILPGPIDTDMFRLSTGEQDAARFDALPRLWPAWRRRCVANMPTLVSSIRSTQAASTIVDAILDSAGPMRYGCDPVSLGAARPLAPVRRRDGLHHDRASPSSTRRASRSCFEAVGPAAGPAVGTGDVGGRRSPRAMAARGA